MFGFGKKSGKGKGKERQRERERAQKETQDGLKKMIENAEKKAQGLQERVEQELREKERKEAESAAAMNERQIVSMRENQEELERRRGMIMDMTEQGGEKNDFSMGSMGLVDRLEAHQAGKLLKNVVISNEPPPDRELNLTRLRRFKPQNDFSKMTLADVPEFKLTGEYQEFSIVDAMTADQFLDLKGYVLVSDVFIHYVPLDSFYSVSSPVHFLLNDFRKVDNTTMRKFPLTHSGGYNILMTLDYCVAKEDMKYLSLSISTSLASFRKGTAWGAAKVLLTISHMNFPVKANMQETMGVLHMSDSDLREYISDPRGSDGVITPQALKLLRGHYMRGEIENINLPRDDVKEVNMARTVIGGGEENVSVRDIMANVREQGLKDARKHEASKPRKSAMKKPRDRPMSPSVESDDESNGLSDLDDIQVGESLSNAGSGETVDLPRRNSSPPRRMSSVNFGS